MSGSLSRLMACSISLAHNQQWGGLGVVKSLAESVVPCAAEELAVDAAIQLECW